MKYNISIEADYYEDKEEVYCLVHAREFREVIGEIKELIRSKLKYESPSEETCKVLEQIQSMIYSRFEIDY